MRYGSASSRAPSAYTAASPTSSVGMSRGGGSAPVSPQLLHPRSPPVVVSGWGWGGGAPSPICAYWTVETSIVGASKQVAHAVPAISSIWAIQRTWVVVPASLSAWVEESRSTSTFVNNDLRSTNKAKHCRHVWTGPWYYFV